MNAHFLSIALLFLSINWTVARPSYQIYMIKISVSPENRSLDFIKLFERAEVFPNLLACVYFKQLFNHNYLTNESTHHLITSLSRHNSIFSKIYWSRIMRKPDFCLGENKGADQLRGNREADQRLCFRYTDSTISLLLKSEISSF